MKIFRKSLATLLVIATLMSCCSMMRLNAFAASSESESNNTYSTADTLSLNSTISGKMSDGNDVDFYKITASSNGKLVIKFNHTYVDNSSVYWYVNIYHYTGGNLEELSYKKIYGTSNESVSFPAIGTVSSGAYYVKVSTYNNVTSNYSYSISNTFSSTSYYEKEFNNSFATATSMSHNNDYSGYMNSTSDSDYYKVTTSYKGKLSISFNHTYVDDSYVYWYVYIYRYVDGAYKELSYKKIYGTSNESIAFPVIGTESSGTYYVKISTYNDSTTNHQYSITNRFETTNYFEKELNNSYATADVISLNNTFGGYMNSNSDSDFYKITLSSQNTISFIFNHNYVNDSYVYWYVNVYKYENGAYNEIAYKKIYGGDSENYYVINSQSLSAGTYYIKITTYNDSTTNYQYSIRFTGSSNVNTYYTLSYNANGGSGAPSSQTGKTTYTISSVKPTRSGYTFLGWSKSSNATSAAYVPGDSITISSNTTLYAVWKKNSSSTTPTFTLTSENLVLKKGEYEDVTLAVIWNGFNGKISVRYEIDEKSVCSLEYGEWNSGKINLRIKGKDVGTAVVKLSMFDVDTGTIYYTKNIKVKVASPTIELNDKNASVNVGEYIDLSIYCPKNDTDVKRTVTYTIGDEEIVSAEWLNWIDDNANLRIHGLSQGSTTIKLELTDTTTGELYDTETITVEVIDPTAVPVYTFWEWLVIIFLFGWIWYI